MNATVTLREFEVAEAIAFGETDKEVANHLHITALTVRTYRKRIYEKTGCRNTADLTRWVLGKMLNIKIERGQVKHTVLVMLFLSITVMGEFMHTKFLRTRTLRAPQAKVSKARTRKPTEKNFEYATV